MDTALPTLAHWGDISVPPSAPIHCGITCRDVDATMRFLCECLGFERVSLGAPAVPGIVAQIVGVPGADARVGHVRLGTLAVELLEYSAPADRRSSAPRPCDVGFAHLAVRVVDVPATVAAAADFGFVPAAAIVTVPAGPHQGQQVVYLRDGSGFTVELMSDPPPAY